MPLDKIVAKISQDAKLKAQAFIDQAQAEARQYLKQAETKIEAECRQLLAAGEERANREKKQRLQIATLDIRKQILAEKQGLIISVFDQALLELQRLDNKKYASIIKNLLDGYPLMGDEEIIVSPADRKRLGEGFLGEINRQLKRQGKRGECVWSAEQRNIKGGFIVRRGKIEANYSFESLLKSQREELEQQVAQLLFDEPKSSKE